jgi:hypothetical protein
MVVMNPARWLLAILVVLALLGLGVVTGAIRGSADDGRDEAQLHAGTLAAQLTNTANIDFTATYRSTDGTEITLTNAHRPDRMSASARDWTLIIDREAITECHRRDAAMRCATRAGAGQPMWQFGEESDRVAATSGKRDVGFGLILADDAATLLWDVVRRPTDGISQRRTVIANRAATCLNVPSVEEPFDVCVTEDGLLGAFTGTRHGRPVTTTLLRYDPIAYTSALELPKGAVPSR